jgi:hypothetical protein
MEAYFCNYERKFFKNYLTEIFESNYRSEKIHRRILDINENKVEIVYW